MRKSKTRFVIGDEIIVTNKIISIESLNKALSINIRRKHKMSLSEFLDKNGFNVEKCRFCKKEYPTIKALFETTDNENEYKVIGFNYNKKIYCYGLNKKCDGIKYNPNSVIFISTTLGISKEAALKYIKDNNKSSFYVENHTSQEDYKKSQSRDINYFKEKYGEKYEDEYIKYCNKISESNSLKSYIDKHGRDEGIKIWKNIQKSKDNSSFKYFLKKNNDDINRATFEFNEKVSKTKITIENLIKKHGIEDGSVKYTELIEKKRYINTKQYYIDKYGENEGLLKYKEKSDKLSYYNTLEHYIDKYGENEGSLKYGEYRSKLSTNIDKLILKYNDIDIAKEIYTNFIIKVSNNHTVSKESINFFKILISIITDFLGVQLTYVYGYQNEFYIVDDSNYKDIKVIYYDLLIEDFNLIIEYNGVYWHPNPEWKLEKLESWTHPKNNTNYTHNLSIQERRENIAKEKGYDIINIYNDNPIHDNIMKILSYIKNKIN